ncbi:nitrogen regulation protein NR(I) [Litorivicinus lipolyticus]|uniref:DNA-binding transcriptional regulator NtrC n=1 Tax=Litorivicinus lipolyticus TaxID=418701 RepID=A0A5Q2Q8X0_9GAMM|nr:nitrogen regulation protein NR(I) [Litorivicinus lipolyticus]QGG81219.1 nitrogen regulation protein NR(I) [Litorivicinus lipolyticus]
MSATIWVVDDDRSIRFVLERALAQQGYQVRAFENGGELLRALNDGTPALIMSDIRMPGIDGIELLGRIRNSQPELPVIIMTAHSDLDSAVNAYESGAFEYLPKPFDLDDAVALVERAMQAQAEAPTQAPPEDTQSSQLIGAAPAMQEVFRAIGRLSRSAVTVLINGESGSGKELVAKALHDHSPRADKPFVALNMAAIPKDLIESELFGHERGAFTGANSQRRGRFEQASGGTLFLDEIGDMPAETQTRLLRVLSNNEFYRVGGLTPIKVDTRVIAATHQNLEAMVADGRFREDLFHRLNVIRIQIPSLADRAEDVPELARHFLKRASQQLDVECKVLRPETEAILSAHAWPGNVRQLENLCSWLTVMASARDVHPVDLPSEFHQHDDASPARSMRWEASLASWAENALRDGGTEILQQALPEFERVMIQVALAHTGGRKREAADLLGWGRNTLTRKLQELGLDAA